MTAIILIAVFLLFMLGVLILVGLRRSDAKKVSFTTTDEPKELTQQEKSGNYQAHGGFNFAPAKADDKESGAFALRSCTPRTRSAATSCAGTRQGTNSGDRTGCS